MDILRVIKEQILDDSIKLSSILRKVRVLADTTKTKTLENWVKFEINGYQNIQDVPEYRTFSVISYGCFSGPFQLGIKDIPLNLYILPKEIRRIYETVYVSDGIRSIEILVDDKRKDLRKVWPQHIVAEFQDKFMRHMNLYYAYQSFSSHLLEQVLESTRNRLLEFILELINAKPKTDDSNEEIYLPNETIEIAIKKHLYGSYNSTGE